MATTTMTSANNLTVKQWEMKTWLQAMRSTAIGHVMNTNSCYVTDRFEKDDIRGDEVTFSYAGKLTSVPTGEGGTLVNNVEALNLQSHKMSQNVCRFGVESPNTDTIEQKRTYVDFGKVGMTQLGRRAVELLDASFFNQAAGANPTSVTIDGTTYSGANRQFIQGMNSIVAPTSNRIVRPGGAATDQALTSSDTMTLDLVDAAVELAETTEQPLERLGGNYFDLFIHPFQEVDLKRDSSGRIQWYQNALAYTKDGMARYLEDAYYDSTIRCIGEYNNVRICIAPRVATGVSSADSSNISTVRRAVLLGRDAVSFGSSFGGRITDEDVPVKYFYEYRDFDYYKAMEARLLYGLKKMTPSNQDDIGVITISTYATNHY